MMSGVRCVIPSPALVLLVLATAAPAAAQQVDPFARDVRTYDFSASYLLESWNKNLSSEQLVSGLVTAGASWAPGWQAVTEFAFGRAVLNDGPDAAYVGITGGVRRRIVGHGRTNVYVDALFGIAVANRHVPGRGSSFNWIAQGGGGFAWPVASRAYGVFGLRVFCWTQNESPADWTRKLQLAATVLFQQSHLATVVRALRRAGACPRRPTVIRVIPRSQFSPPFVHVGTRGAVSSTSLQGGGEC
jgi:hypothetical protein